MQKLFFLLLLFPMILTAQHTLTVYAENVKESKGKISVALYDTEEGFLKFDKVFKTSSSKAVKEKTTLTINNIPSGTYAMAIFHDENSNEKLDTNFMGIPKEPLGFSIGKMKTFGPPSFQECSFKLDSDKEIVIVIK